MLSLDYMSKAKRWADELGIPVHLDGARVFNAAEALGVNVAEIAKHATSVQFCLSKVCDAVNRKQTASAWQAAVTIFVAHVINSINHRPMTALTILNVWYECQGC